MRISLIFLGSGAPDAGPDDMPAVAARLGSNTVLLDCGEGTQHKLVSVGVGLGKVSSVLITHLHGDHVLGLAPLIQTRVLTTRPTPTLTAIGPPGLRSYLESSFNHLFFDPDNTLEVLELSENDDVRLRDIVVRAVSLDHTVATLGYVISYGKDFTLCYLTDTRPLGVDRLGFECSVLIHDSTFSWIDLGRAEEFKHSTALEAAIIAEKVKAKMLFLYHISSRYKNRRFLEAEARRYASNTYASTKYMQLALTL